jgi:membrane protein YdbS with pleckstrin-like domain
VIRIQCDKCDETIEVDDSRAGEKIDCPHCGDVNRIPEAAAAAPPAGAAPAPQAAPVGAPGQPADRPTEMGLPPDHGPEKHVISVRPAMFRAHPFVGTLTTLLTLAGIVAAIYFQAVWWLLATAAGLIVILVWSILRLSVCLKITNKRCLLQEGLLSRSTSEVLHDHVRNVQTDQSLLERVLNVGSVGISSSGQGGIEIQVSGVPNPGKIREIVDAYRPL